MELVFSIRMVLGALRPCGSHGHRTNDFELHRFVSDCEIIHSQIVRYNALLAGRLTKCTIRTRAMQDSF